MNMHEHGWSTRRTVLIGGLFVGVGSVLGRLPRNWIAGIRTPWTMRSPHVWSATHRVGGRLLIVLGLATISTGILLPTSAKRLVNIGGVLWAVIATGYSFVAWRSEERDGNTSQ